VKERLSIKEFARFSRIEQTTLRYWDDIGLFSPSRRDPVNNYRYYSLEQIIAVKFIAVLSDLNVPLKAIANIEQDRDPEKIIELISGKERQLGLELLRIQQQFSILHTRRRLIEEGNRVLREHDLDFTEEERASKESSKIAISLSMKKRLPTLLGRGTTLRLAANSTSHPLIFALRQRISALSLAYPLQDAMIALKTS